jgi:hypothetical protein
VKRPTTLEERRPPADLGSPELIARKARAANGSGAAVELVDVVGILNAHDLLDTELTLIAWLLADWLRQVRRAFHLSQASPNALWAAIASGTSAGQWVPAANTPGADRALFRLASLYEYFAELDQLAQLSLVMGIVEGTVWPATRRDLLELRTGLQAIASLQRRGRGRRPSVEALA